jgi:hypothetical protein
LKATLSSAFRKRCLIFAGMRLLAGGMNTTESMWVIFRRVRRVYSVKRERNVEGSAGEIKLTLLLRDLRPPRYRNVSKTRVGSLGGCMRRVVFCSRCKRMFRRRCSNGLSSRSVRRDFVVAFSGDGSRGGGTFFTFSVGKGRRRAAAM